MKNLHVTFILNDERLSGCSITRGDCLLLNIALEDLISSIRQGNKMKIIRIGKEEFKL